MKISGVSYSSIINFDKKVAEQTKKQLVEFKNQTEMAKGTLAEAIGRSQVSFKGDSTLNGNILQYQNVSMWKGSESFIYNKEDGSIEYEEYTTGNVLKKGYKFNPQKGTEVITLLEDAGTTTIETKEPGSYTFERIDEEGNPLYREEADDSSEESKKNKITVNYEYGDKAREIIRRYRDGQVFEVEVIDSRTGEVVTEGRLLESRYKRSDGTIVTKNIVTGDVYEVEKKVSGKRVHYEEYSRKTLALIHEFKTDKNTGETTETKYTDDGQNLLFRENKTASGFVLYSATYSPETLKLTHEVFYDSKAGSTTTKEFTNDGVIQKQTIVEKNGKTIVSDYDKNGKLTKVVSTSKNKRDVDIYEYDEKGNITSDTNFKYRLNGKLVSKTVYVPGEEIIDKKYEYKDELNYTEYTYDVETADNNVPVSSKKYECGVLMVESLYHPDGETVSEEIVYNDDRSFEYSKYDEYGEILEKTYCTEKAIPYEFEKYNERGIVTKRVKILKGMGLVDTFLYDPISGKRHKYTRKTDNKQTVFSVEYYPDGKTQKIVRDYNQDGSYVRREYDEFGTLISEKKFPPKSKQADNSEQAGQTENSSTTGRAKEQNIDELINSLARRVAATDGFDGSNIPQAEVDAILKILADYKVQNIQTPDDLFSMNKKQYRTVAMTFHPDKHSGETLEDQERASKLFQIMSNIYSNSPNEGV